MTTHDKRNNTNAIMEDKLLSSIITAERKKQETYITLIASENHITPHLLHYYQKSLLFNNEYAEGYPGKRYYGGCQESDAIENLAIDRAKILFQAEYANVQPHSGSQANAAVLMALLSPGDCLLGMKLSHGGHLTHGASISFAGHFYSSIGYGVNPEGYIDYEEVEALAQQHRPKVIIAGCSAYPRIIDWQRFRVIADQVGAYLVADIAHIAGLVAAGAHPSPLPFADVVTTTTHKTLRGPRGGMILSKDARFAKIKKLNRALFPGIQGGPLMHIIAAKAAAFYEALQPEFIEYQHQIIRNAQAMATVMQQRGFSMISKGTDNHLLLIDLSDRHYSGQLAETRLEAAHLITNKNMLPNDTRPASETSGLRLGTPALTTRGCQVREAEQVAHWVADILEHITDDAMIESVRHQVLQLCHSFPLYRTLSYV